MEERIESIYLSWNTNFFILILLVSFFFASLSLTAFHSFIHPHDPFPSRIPFKLLINLLPRRRKISLTYRVKSSFLISERFKTEPFHCNLSPSHGVFLLRYNIFPILCPLRFQRRFLLLRMINSCRWWNTRPNLHHFIRPFLMLKW